MFKCELFNLESLAKRRKIARDCQMFMYDLLSGTVDSVMILSLTNFRVPSYSFRNQLLFDSGFYRTLYGCREPVTNLTKLFNESLLLFDFNVSRESFKRSLKQESLSSE